LIKYRLLDGREVTDFEYFNYNNVKYPPNWLSGQTDEELAKINIVKLPDDGFASVITPETPQIDPAAEPTSIAENPSLTMSQFKGVLLQYNYLQTVTDVIESMGTQNIVYIKWEYDTEVTRYFSQLTDLIQEILKLTDEQIDQLFLQGKLI
jgi:hypothetical protein